MGDRLENGGQLNSAIQPLLTDLYQLTMAYGYWKNLRNDFAVFDLFFRKNPFNGEFTIFAGLSDALQFLKNFKFTQSDVDYLKKAMPPNIENEFYEFLKAMDLNDVKLYAIPEGSIVFPKVPLMRIEGPLIKIQLLETTLLVLVNYASLVTTNALRYRLIAGEKAQLLEFGLRRAQGCDGGLSGSKYCYIGGFDGTSNVLAGKLYDIPIKGTNAHAFISSFKSIQELKIQEITGQDGKAYNLAQISLKYQKELKDIFGRTDPNEGELASFVAYAIAFPNNFLVLIDNYNVLKSGIVNFIAIGLAMNEAGYRPIGVRIDSGDLAYISNEVRKYLKIAAEKYNLEWLANSTIVVSNDINDDVLQSLNAQSHEINSFGIGTHLITCQKQPALGCVFKLVEVNGSPCMKLSEDLEKVTFPGRKDAFRLYDSQGLAACDVLIGPNDNEIPTVNTPFLCSHPIHATKRLRVTPSRVEPLYKLYWKDGQVLINDSIHKIRERVSNQVKSMRPDHIRILNPTPYKVSVSEKYRKFISDLWLELSPIGEIK